jgi:hypothetical protein
MKMIFLEVCEVDFTFLQMHSVEKATRIHKNDVGDLKRRN